MIIDENSIFPIIVFSNGDEWEEVLKIGAPNLDKKGLDRFKASIGSSLKTLIVERHYIDKDYRDTFSNYYSKRFQTPDSRCIRLHFFSELLDKVDLDDADKLQNSYLGYSVIRPTRPNCVGRTLIAPQINENSENMHIRICAEKIHLRGIDLEVEGFPFISQDVDVTVCAQSALWMILRYYSNRYPFYGEIHPYQIGTLTNDYSIGRIFPSNGLFMWQMAEAMKQCRFEPLIYTRSAYPNQFDHLLYTYIESGIPCLLGVPDHVVAAYGHFSDINSVTIPGDGEIHYSSEFNQGFVINDDNSHPYQLLYATEPKDTKVSKYKVSDIDSFIAPLPDKVYLTPEAFQKIVERWLEHFKPKSDFLKNKTLLLRSFLTTCVSFKRCLEKRGMGHLSVTQMYRNLPMPHFIWVCEVSTPEAYEEGKIHGEIIWDATRNGHETSGLVAFHLTETFIVDVGSVLNRVEKLSESNLKNSCPYDLYISNLQLINQKCHV